MDKIKFNILSYSEYIINKNYWDILRNFDINL